VKRDYILNESTRLSFGYEIFYIQALCDINKLSFDYIMFYIQTLYMMNFKGGYIMH